MALTSLPNSVCGNTTPCFIGDGPPSAARCAGRRERGEEPLIGQRRSRFVWIERLDTDVIRARRPVLVHAAADARGVAPRDDLVDEAIRAAAGEIGRRIAEAEQVLAVVGQLEIADDPRPADASRPRGIGL